MSVFHVVQNELKGNQFLVIAPFNQNYYYFINSNLLQIICYLKQLKINNFSNYIILRFIIFLLNKIKIIFLMKK